MNDIFSQLILVYAEAIIDFPNLKGITVAQWILESGRGTSRLAIEHLNFGGLKWQPEMEEFATPVDYQASAEVDKYCKFESLEKFIEGYWHSLESSLYEGWRENVGSPEEFINFIGPIYGENNEYVSKVLNVFTEAKQLLAAAEHSEHHIGTQQDFRKPLIKAFYRSPNQSSRNGGIIDKIILHFTTAGTFESTKNYFLDPKSQLSAHYIIDKNGDIYQMVSDSQRAWHSVQANKTSIGIEHVAKVGQRLTAAQEKSSITLIKWLLAEYEIPKSNIKAHKEILSTDCPGNIFGDDLNSNDLTQFKKWVAKNF